MGDDVTVGEDVDDIEIVIVALAVGEVVTVFDADAGGIVGKVVRVSTCDRDEDELDDEELDANGDCDGDNPEVEVAVVAAEADIDCAADEEEEGALDEEPSGETENSEV